MDTCNKARIMENRLKLRNSIKAVVKSSVLEISNKNINCISKEIASDSLLSSNCSETSSFESSTSIRSKVHNEKFEEEFDLGQKIGVGSQSIVHECIEKSTGKKYAVKIIKKCGEQNLEQIKETFNLMQELQHPNIVKVEKMFVQRGTKKIKMITEICEFKDLKHYLISLKAKKTKMGEAEAVLVLQKLFGVLAYLKQKRICHRDIKPQNILYDPLTHELKLIDFEISRINRIEDQKMDLWSNSGSIYYRAPESIKGGYDERVDMWAAGVILFEILAGKLPFFSEYENDTKKKILNGSISCVNIEASNDLVCLLRRLLEKNPNLRISPDEALAHSALNKKEEEVNGFSTNHSQNSFEVRVINDSLVEQDFLEEFDFEPFEIIRKRSSSNFY